MQDSLFKADEIEVKSPRFDFLPVSVFNIGPQHERNQENHATASSRQNFSPFPKEVGQLVVEYFLKGHGNIFDPFAGWGERHLAAKTFGKNYTGFDFSPEAITHAKNRYGVTNIYADSTTEKLPDFDCVFTCPPYWNLEKYAGDGIDSADCWHGFIHSIDMIWARIYEAAPIGTRFCIMVGDWRKDGRYYDFEYKTCQTFEDLGALVFDKVVISREKISKIKIMLPQAKRLGYTVHVHEMLLVFDKVK